MSNEPWELLPDLQNRGQTGGSGQAGHGPSRAFRAFGGHPALGGQKPPCLCVSPSPLSLLLRYGSSCRDVGTVPRPSREGLSSPCEAVRIAAGPHARWLGFSGGRVAFPTARTWDRPARSRLDGPRSRTRRPRLLRVPSSRKRLRNPGIRSLRQGPQRSFLVHFSFLL